MDQINSVSSALMQTLHLANDQYRGQIGRMVREMESRGLELLDDFEDHVKSDQLSLPVDATVHQLNADTVHFIESVEPFYETLGQIIAKKDERSVSPVEAYVNYKSDLLSALSMNINNKAEDYKNQSAKCVFLMNNFHFVKARLGQLYTKTGNSQKLEEARVALEKEYSEMEEAAYAEYFATVWSKLSLIARPDHPVQLNSKLNDKEKDQIKGKFRRFNSFFDEITQANRSLTITDGTQLTRIKEGIKQTVIPAYIDMLDKYGNRDTTKGNTSKYVKYTTEMITSEIEKLFDLSA